ncbi:MAG: ATP-binding protein [Lachnospiraceae bacterium]
MILKEAYIENFGKLHKEEIVFRPGINVICGGNEAGKTTFAGISFRDALWAGTKARQK